METNKKPGTKPLKLKIAKSGAVLNPKSTLKDNTCKTMEDVYLAYGIDTKDKKYKFNQKFKALLKEVQYKPSKRTQKAVVASPELTDGVVGQLQAKFWLNEEIEIRSNAQIHEGIKDIKSNKRMKEVYISMNRFIEQHVKDMYGNDVKSNNGDFIELATGNVALTKAKVMEAVKELGLTDEKGWDEFLHPINQAALRLFVLEIRAKLGARFKDDN